MKRNELSKLSGVQVEDSEFDLAMVEICEKWEEEVMICSLAKRRRQKLTEWEEKLD